MKLRCLIVDDEPLALDVLENYIQQLDSLDLVARCENPLEAFSLLQKDTNIDLVFLDINMPKLTGLDLLKGLTHSPAIVITTAYRDYAVESFELDVVDYLVKPISFPRFLKSLDKVHRRQGKMFEENSSKQNTKENKHLFVKVDKKMVKIYLDDIFYIESLKDYIRIKTSKGEFVTYQTLSSFTEQLPQKEFARVHRSYTIALDKVSAVEGNSLELAGKFIPLARNNRREIMQRLYGDAL